jgi:hypothetical protein
LQNSATFGIGWNPYCGGHRTGYLSTNNMELNIDELTSDQGFD